VVFLPYLFDQLNIQIITLIKILISQSLIFEASRFLQLALKFEQLHKHALMLLVPLVPDIELLVLDIVFF
jgi:hypothetical protein